VGQSSAVHVNGGAGRYVAFTVDAARDLTYTIRVKHERQLAHRIRLSLTSWALVSKAHLSEYVLATHLRLFGNRSPPAVLQCKRGGRTYRSDLRAYKYVTAP